MVQVELIYIAADQNKVQLTLTLKEGATVADALQDSGILKSHPEVQNLSYGIFAKRVTGDTILKEGDRIEIYRPLILDPKEKRRRRSKK